MAEIHPGGQKAFAHSGQYPYQGLVVIVIQEMNKKLRKKSNMSEFEIGLLSV